jgi:hypothetical protein
VAPPSCATAWTTSMAYMAAETQASLQAACWRAGLLSLVIAFAVLMAATRNLTVSLFATGTIATILFWTVVIVVAMGWELGLMESMDIAILIGISCDFVVHFSHSYCECSKDGQQERMTHALHTMGISVVAAAVTTFFASAVHTDLLRQVWKFPLRDHGGVSFPLHHLLSGGAGDGRPRAARATDYRPNRGGKALTILCAHEGRKSRNYLSSTSNR